MSHRSRIMDDHAQGEPANTGHRSLLALFDYCKGLAIMGVVLVHVLHGWFGWQGVHVFIVLSGFGLLYSRRRSGATESWRRWSLRRAERILPTYWLVALCGWAVVVVVQRLRLSGPSTTVQEPALHLLLDLALLRNFAYQGMFGYPNASLWYVPLIVGCYLVFPVLATLVLRQRDGWRLLRLLLAGLAVEALCRALAVYGLDGMPVGYGHGFWPGLPRLERARDLLPASFPFQLWAPFGLFLTRIGEFLAGMIAAELYVRDRQRFSRALLNPWAALAGMLLWLVGNALLYAGLWGWVVADVAIGLGLSVALLNLAALSQRALARVFAAISACGRWSHYLFLSHLLVMYVHVTGVSYVAPQSLALNLVLLLLTATMIGVACWLLRRFDQSRWPRMMIEQTLGRLLVDTTKDTALEPSPQSLRSGP